MSRPHQSSYAATVARPLPIHGASGRYATGTLGGSAGLRWKLGKRQTV